MCIRDRSVDYPDVAAEVAGKVSADDAQRGVLICGSGIGMSIAANKLAGVRAVAAQNQKMAEMSRRHNDANIICLSDADISGDENLKLVKIFLATEFEGGRHQRRVDKISKLEE